MLRKCLTTFTQTKIGNNAGCLTPIVCRTSNRRTRYNKAESRPPKVLITGMPLSPYYLLENCK